MKTKTLTNLVELLICGEFIVVGYLLPEETNTPLLVISGFGFGYFLAKLIEYF
jgi:hypothetical protein